MFAESLADHLEYILFLCGLVCLLLATACLVLRRQDSHHDGETELPWGALALFGLLGAVQQWMEMCRVGFIDSRALGIVHTIFVGLSLGMLGEFARRGWGVLGIRRVGIWIYLPLLAVIGVLTLTGWQSFEAAVRYCLGGVCGVAAVGLVVTWSLRLREGKKLGCASAGFLTLYILATCVAREQSGVWPADWLNPSSFESWGQVPSAIFRAAAMLGLTICLWIRISKSEFGSSQEFLRYYRLPQAVMVGGLLLMAIGGWFVANHLRSSSEGEVHRQLLSRINTVADLASAELREYAQLPGGAGTTAYEKLRAKLTAVCDGQQDIRYLYLFGLRGEQAIFLMDTEPARLSNPAVPLSRPGEPYPDASAELKALLHGEGTAFVEGPLKDSWGTWISGLAPIRDETGRVCAVLGMDMEASRGKHTADLHRMAVIFVALLASVMLIGGYLIATRMGQFTVRLLASSDLHRSLVEGSPNCIMMLDSEGRCLSINENGLKTLGLRRSDCVGAGYVELWPPASRLLIGECLEKAQSGIQATAEAAFLCQDGSERFFYVVLNPLDPERGGGQIVTIVLDITDKREAEDISRNAIREAQVATNTKSEFLANMSHEIRTPLTAILGFTDLLSDGTHTAAEQKGWLMTIQRNGHHLLSLINDILDVSKIDADKMEISMSRCNPTAILSDIMNMMRLRAEERGVAMQTEYRGELPQLVLCDEVRLRQILVNLVGNAVKFTDRGFVRVAVGLVPNWREGETGIRFDVIDSGMGISAEKVQRLGEPFYQGDSSSSRQFQGTGLGLAISRRLVTMMHGDFEIQSALGHGSTFSVTLPTGDLSGAEMIGPRQEGTGVELNPTSSAADLVNSLRGLRILLAEDGPDNQRLLGTILRKAGAEVMIAENGQSAVQIVIHGSFDLVLMDMQMPKMDGYQATRFLRQSGSTLPIIALTAHAMASDRDRCLEAGCSDYLTKPVDRSTLIKLICKYVSPGPREALELVEGRPAVEATAEVDAAAEIEETPVGAVSADAVSAGALETVSAATRAENSSWRSLYADDPDLGKIVHDFAGRLPQRVEVLRSALANNLLEEVRQKAHQLRGAGSGYGFPAVARLAAAIEQCMKANDTEGARLKIGELDTIVKAIVAANVKPAKRGS